MRSGVAQLLAGVGNKCGRASARNASPREPTPPRCLRKLRVSIFRDLVTQDCGLGKCPGNIWSQTLHPEMRADTASRGCDFIMESQHQ